MFHKYEYVPLLIAFRMYNYTIGMFPCNLITAFCYFQIYHFYLKFFQNATIVLFTKVKTYSIIIRLVTRHVIPLQKCIAHLQKSVTLIGSLSFSTTSKITTPLRYS